jgi:acyl-coenzyme A thioesterase PaaI-like protein
VLLKETLLLRAVGLSRIPMLLFVAPRVLRLDEEGCEVQVPLSFRTRNHVGSMYFGALATGADVTCGLNAWFAIQQRFRGVQLLLREARASFLQRADGAVHFTCRDGRAILEGVARAHAERTRVEVPVTVTATVPRRHGEAPVARFDFALTLKGR